MQTGGLGQILALVGFILLLVAGVGRQRARQRPTPPSGAFQLFQTWGSLAAFALIVLGLLLMAAAK